MKIRKKREYKKKFKRVEQYTISLGLLNLVSFNILYVFLFIIICSSTELFYSSLREDILVFHYDVYTLIIFSTAIILISSQVYDIEDSFFCLCSKIFLDSFFLGEIFRIRVFTGRNFWGLCFNNAFTWGDVNKESKKCSSKIFGSSRNF